MSGSLGKGGRRLEIASILATQWSFLVKNYSSSCRGVTCLRAGKPMSPQKPTQMTGLSRPSVSGTPRTR